VQPIRNADDIRRLKERLLSVGGKYYLMFVIGINTGLRVSDILNLTVGDVRDKTHVMICEKKTGKRKRFMINEKLRNEIDGYISGVGDMVYLVKSRKGLNRPINRCQAYKVLNDAAKSLGISEVGTHTMRKTFGYWHYKQHKDVAILQDIFNHSAPSITLKYIGIDDDVKDSTLKNFFL
jgi:integrase